MSTTNHIKLELLVAGADEVSFRHMDDNRLEAIGVRKGDQRKAFAWRPQQQDGTALAVSKLKRWLRGRAHQPKA